MEPTLHLLGVPHTVTNDDRFSHCAFTTKVNRFIPMMSSVGYRVIHYGNSNSTGLNAIRGFSYGNVQIFSPSELERLIGKYDPASSRFVGEDTDAGRALCKEFNARLVPHLEKNVRPNDIICLPFGYAHHEALVQSRAAQNAYQVETGIGYEDSFARFKIFESHAWMHYHYGKQQASGKGNRGSDYHWVIPNYFDLDEWKPYDGPGEYVLYFGRICEAKGMSIVREIALRRPDLKFVVCGQGDGTPWLTPNMELRAPVHGAARSGLLRKAIAVLVPSRYVEPFGGVAVEAMLCGRPVLASVYGAFGETLAPGCFQCRTLFDWLAALKRVEEYPRWAGYLMGEIRTHAEQFDMFRLARQYKRAFKQISQLRGSGWFSLDSP